MLVRDDFTRKSWILFLLSKSDAYMGLKDFLSDASADAKVHIVWSDNRGEFRSCFSELCSEQWIRQEFISSDRPQNISVGGEDNTLARYPGSISDGAELHLTSTGQSHAVATTAQRQL